MNKVMDYDYLKAVEDDVWSYVVLNYTDEQLKAIDREELEETLYDDLWVVDSVTGNGSGAYCDKEHARYYINGDDNAETYIRELISDYCIEAKTVADHLFDWQYWDVSIRCYLLGRGIEAALDRVYKGLQEGM